MTGHTGKASLPTTATHIAVLSSRLISRCRAYSLQVAVVAEVYFVAPCMSLGKADECGR